MYYDNYVSERLTRRVRMTGCQPRRRHELQFVPRAFSRQAMMRFIRGVCVSTERALRRPTVVITVDDPPAGVDPKVLKIVNDILETRDNNDPSH